MPAPTMSDPVVSGYPLTEVERLQLYQALEWPGRAEKGPEPLSAPDVSSGPPIPTPAEWLERWAEPSLPPPPDGGVLLRRLLRHPAMPTKPWIAHHLDPRKPRLGEDGFGIAAPVLRVHGSQPGLLVSRETLGGAWDQAPRRGAMHAVCEASRTLVAVGARPRQVLVWLPGQGPHVAHRAWVQQETLGGVWEAAQRFSLGAWWEGAQLEQSPFDCAPSVAVVGDMQASSTPCTPYFKQEGQLIGLLGEPGGVLGGSVYQQVMGWPRLGMPAALRMDEEHAVQEACRALLDAQLLASAHAVAEGGLAVALAECCLGPLPVGAQLELRCQAFSLAQGARRWDLCWFGEVGGRFLISYPASHEPQVRAVAQRCNAPFQRLGVVEGASLFIPGVLDEPIALLLDLYAQSFLSGAT